MTPEPPTPTPRRKRRYFLWLGVLLLVLFAYRGWKEYDYRAAVKEAKALGWSFVSSSPFDDIKEDWHDAIRLETWTKIRRELYFINTNGFISHESLILRLNPQIIAFTSYPSTLNLSFLKHLSDLRSLWIGNCPKITDANMDQIAELRKLKGLHLFYCRSLTQLKPFIKLTKLEQIYLSLLPLIPKADIKAFRIAHSDANVTINP